MATTPTTLSFGGNPATGEAPTTYNVDLSQPNGVGSQVPTATQSNTTGTSTTRTATPTPATTSTGLSYSAGVAANAANPPQYGEQGQLLNPSPAGTASVPVTTTQTTPTPATTPAPTAPLTPPATATPAATAVTQLQASGAAPQTAAEAASAVNQALPVNPTFYKPTTPVPGFNPQTVFNAQGQPLTYDQYIAQGGKPDFSNVQAGSPPPPTSQQPAASQIAPISNVPATIAQALAQDPGYQKILAAAQTAQSSQAQSETLEQQFSDLMNQYNIPQINTEMINDQAIINGTDTDIENEVKASGGFVTQSQVDALAAARDKTIIQNYNTLLATKTDAMNTINTMIGLASQDRQFAQTQANNDLSIAEQEASYQQKFIQNQQEDYNAVISSVGYAGLYQALLQTGGQNSVDLASQILGYPPGGLEQLANQSSSLSQTNAITTSVTDMMKSYPDAGILPTDSLQVAQQKLNASPTYQEDLQSKNASINASNASASSSEESAAKTAADLAFENANGGMTQAEVEAQKVAEDAQVQKFQLDAATLIGNMVNKTIDWNTAWNQLHAEFPQASTETIDNALNATEYRSKYGG